jgi:hypothetical protein
MDELPITGDEADVFAWEPPRRYDTVFFAFWLTHVPPARFAGFWSMVGRALAPGGRVCFLDDSGQGRAGERFVSGQATPAVWRRLRDGSEHRVVKVYYSPAELAARPAELGWSAEIREVMAGEISGMAITQVFLFAMWRRRWGDVGVLLVPEHHRECPAADRLVRVDVAQPGELEDLIQLDAHRQSHGLVVSKVAVSAGRPSDPTNRSSCTAERSTGSCPPQVPLAPPITASPRGRSRPSRVTTMTWNRPSCRVEGCSVAVTHDGCPW